jgi:uncharacterized protein (TIGR02145 family)
MKKIFIYFAIAAVAFSIALISCKKDVAVTGVTLEKTSQTLVVGDTLLLTATVLPENATNKNVTWTGSDPAIISIVNGKVTALSAGTAIVTVTTQDGSKTATCSITVTLPVASIVLSKISDTLAVGDTLRLTATISPEAASNKTIIWTSHAPNIASVVDGKITALAAGLAIITATTEDGDKTATCSITVVIPVTDVVLSKTSDTLAVGGILQLTATVLPENATNKTVIWTSSAPDIASVVDGKVTALSDGLTIITATSQNKSVFAVCSLVVRTPPVLSVHHDTTSRTRELNTSFSQLSVTAAGATPLSYQWYSNTEKSNIGGTPVGTNSPTYIPSASSMGTLYYYCEISNVFGTVTSNVSGAHTVTCATPALSVHPDTTTRSKVLDDVFSALSVTAAGTAPLSYRWYSNTVKDNTNGTLILDATSATYTPPCDAVGTLYYYCEISNPCGTTTSNVSGAHVVFCAPVIASHPSTASQAREQNVAFSALSVTAIGTAPLSYQWYSNTTNNNTSGTLISGATESTYTPSSSTTGVLYYYCVVANSCGSTTSNVSGMYDVYVINANKCNTRVPGYSITLGDLFYGSTTNRHIDINATVIDGNGVFQIWSGVVRASNCNKTAYNGGSTSNYNADCRVNTDRSVYGDLFSWCAVVRYQHILCPAPWRVPTRQNFVDLDRALGGTNNGGSYTNQTVRDRYVATDGDFGQFWGGTYGGILYAGSPVYQGNRGHYWSITESSAEDGNCLEFSAFGGISPGTYETKHNGLVLRCVRDKE